MELNIFISSTCYDLSQIREDLKKAIISLGHNPILSENSNFPINPSYSNTENCINAINQEADVLVLIIGNKYGYKDEKTGKSITNSEYLAAVAKGIPVYTFTLRDMLNYYEVWRHNREGDFSFIVDTNKIFTFIEDVRVKSGRWNFSFSNAQDIIETLKSQLSILFKKSLQSQLKINSCKFSSIRENVSPKVYSILIEKPSSYEMKFLLSNMDETVSSFNDLRKDYEYSILYKADKYIYNVSDFIEYAQLTLGRFQSIVKSLNVLVNEAFNDYYGERGVVSNIEGLYYVSKAYGKLYSALISYAIEVKSIIAKEEFKPALDALSILADKAIRQIEDFPKSALEQVRIAEEIYTGTGVEHNVCLSLKIDIEDEDISRFLQELNRIAGTI